MAELPNPIAAGFRSARRNPAIFLLELLWRWSFWIIAGFLFFGAGMALLGQLDIRDVFLLAWRTQDSHLMQVIGMSLLFKPVAKLLSALGELVALAAVLGFLWSVLATAVRRIVVRRLGAVSPPDAQEPQGAKAPQRSKAPLGFGAMLAVQWLRALVALLAMMLLITVVVIAIQIAIRGGRTDLFRFYLVCSFTIPVVLVLWLVMNCRLSMAAIFGRETQGFRAAMRQARETVRRQRSDFAGTAFIFLLLRVIALIAVLAIGGLTSHMLATAPFFALVGVLALAYFMISDFLYLARIAAYLALAEARVDNIVEIRSAQPSR